MSKETQEGVKKQHPFSEILREGEGPNLEKKEKKKSQEGRKQLTFIFL